MDGKYKVSTFSRPSQCQSNELPAGKDIYLKPPSGIDAGRPPWDRLEAESSTLWSVDCSQSMDNDASRLPLVLRFHQSQQF